MSKKTKKRIPKELTRKQRSRLEQEKRIERWLLVSVIAIAALVVIVLLTGLVMENIVKANQAVATVGDARITTSDFQARVRFNRLQLINQLGYLRQQQASFDPTDSSVQMYLEYIQNNIRDLESQLDPANAQTIGEQALDQLIQDQIVRQEAARRGIVVTREELQKEIEQYFGYEREPSSEATPTASTPLTDELTLTPEPTPTPMTEEEFRRRYDEYMKALKSWDISEKQYRAWIEGSLFYRKLQEQMVAEGPTEAEQVKLGYLSVEDQALAEELVARLDAGEEREAILEAYKLEGGETGPTVYGDEMDWLPRSRLEDYVGPEVAELVFSLPVGEHSRPVQGQGGNYYIIIQVLGRELRPLDESARQQLGEEAFQDWLQAQMEVLATRGNYRDRVPTEPALR